MTERPDKLNNQAIILASGGEYTEAIACFKRALIIERNNYLLWYNLGITYRDCGDIKSARDSLEKAHQIAPERNDVTEALATLCVNQGDFEAALHYAQEGANLAHEYAPFWNLMGVAFFNMEQYTLASENFEQALCINPYYADALFNLRDTYTELHNHTGANECDKRLKELE